MLCFLGGGGKNFFLKACVYGTGGGGETLELIFGFSMSHLLLFLHLIIPKCI